MLGGLGAGAGGGADRGGADVRWSAGTATERKGNSFSDDPVFSVRDRAAGTTTRASVGDREQQGKSDSDGAEISGDGRFVGFESNVTNLVPGDTNGDTDVFVRRDAGPLCGGPGTVQGTAGPDNLLGTPVDNTIAGGAGSDITSSPPRALAHHLVDVARGALARLVEQCEPVAVGVGDRQLPGAPRR